MTRKKSVDEFRLEQLLANRLRFYLGKLRIYSLFEDFLIFLRRLATLFILPLSLEQGCLVDKGKDFGQVFDLDDRRTIERRLWYRDIGCDIRWRSVRRVSRRSG